MDRNLYPNLFPVPMTGKQDMGSFAPQVRIDEGFDALPTSEMSFNGVPIKRYEDIDLIKALLSKRIAPDQTPGGYFGTPYHGKMLAG